MRGKGERGSVLMLVPAGVLVLVILGAIAVDFSSAFLAQRQLSDATVAAANDAATSALSDAKFYRNGGQLVVDPSAAETVVCAAMSAQLDSRIHVTSVDIAVSGRWIHVRASARVSNLIATAIPGVPRARTVSAASAALAERDASDGAPSPPPVDWTRLTCYYM